MILREISPASPDSRERIEDFCRALGSERDYFRVTPERIQGWSLVLAAEDDDSILGIAGLEQRLGTARSAVIVRKDAQGRGLGRALLLALQAKAREKHHMIWAIIDIDNRASIANRTKLGGQLLGVRERLCYYAVPLDFTGRLMSGAARALFPLLKVLDRFRR